MTPGIGESWQRITGWLATHAPVTHRDINPPATAADLAALARHGDLDLPAGLRRWWSLADGIRDRAGASNSLLASYRPLSVRESLEMRQWFVGEQARVVVQPDPECEVAGAFAGPYSHAFVPVGGDLCGNNLFVDLRPGPRRGCLMEWLKGDLVTYAPVWDSVADMLAAVADALANPETGLRRTGYRLVPEVTAHGQLDWEIRQQLA
ncbi:SMI1/KNR4 family protein [Crossiella sp. NPDC003009]